MRRRGLIAGIAWAAAGCSGIAAAAEALTAVEVHAAAPPASTQSPAAEVPERKLTVNRAVRVANGSMLEVRFTVPPAATTRWIPTDQKDTYVLDEATGEKFFVLNLVRIGPAGQVRLPKGGGSSYMIIDNRYEHLKPGARVTVVIGALKQEHVMVTDQ